MHAPRVSGSLLTLSCHRQLGSARQARFLSPIDNRRATLCSSITAHQQDSRPVLCSNKLAALIHWLSALTLSAHDLCSQATALVCPPTVGHCSACHCRAKPQADAVATRLPSSDNEEADSVSPRSTWSLRHRPAPPPYHSVPRLRHGSWHRSHACKSNPLPTGHIAPWVRAYKRAARAIYPPPSSLPLSFGKPPAASPLFHRCMTSSLARLTGSPPLCVGPEEPPHTGVAHRASQATPQPPESPLAGTAPPPRSPLGELGR
jgi:hypothetical protein